MSVDGNRGTNLKVVKACSILQSMITASTVTVTKFAKPVQGGKVCYGEGVLLIALSGVEDMNKTLLLCRELNGIIARWNVTDGPRKVNRRSLIAFPCILAQITRRSLHDNCNGDRVEQV